MLATVPRAVGLGLTDYARLYLADQAGFATRVGVPVLLWAANAQLQPPEEPWARTSSAPRQVRPRVGNPLVCEIKKVEGRKNAFAMGVTVGRVETNDIVLADRSISRFHAWFQTERKTGRWLVVDADSKNGCWLNGVRLVAKAKTPIDDGATVRFGEVDTRFLLPPSFAAYLEQVMRAPRSTDGRDDGGEL